IQGKTKVTQALQEFIQNKLREGNKIDNQMEKEWFKEKRKLPESKTQNLVEPITEEELETALKEASNNSAPGTDTVSYKVLKRCEATRNCLLDTMNKIMENPETYPKEWKDAEMVLIPKKGADPVPKLTQLRPISLTQTSARLFSKIINTRISKLVEEEKLLSPLQLGFRPEHVIGDAVTATNLMLENARREKKELHVVMMDIKAAFDSVSLRTIRVALRAHGLHVLIPLVEQMMTDRKIFIRTEWGLTKAVNMGVGVPQGDPLSPFLFAIVIDALLDKISTHGGEKDIPKPNGFPVPGFGVADDTAAMRTSLRAMQDLINECLKFQKASGLVFAPKKWEYVTQGVTDKETLKVGDHDLKGEKEAKRYLGVPVSLGNKQKITKTQPVVKNTIMGRWHGMRKPLLTTYTVSPLSFVDLVSRAAIPAIMYGAESMVIPEGEIDAMDSRTARLVLQKSRMSSAVSYDAVYAQEGLGLEKVSDFVHKLRINNITRYAQQQNYGAKAVWSCIEQAGHLCGIKEEPLARPDIFEKAAMRTPAMPLVAQLAREARKEKKGIRTKKREQEDEHGWPTLVQWLGQETFLEACTVLGAHQIWTTAQLLDQDGIHHIPNLPKTITKHLKGKDSAKDNTRVRQELRLKAVPKEQNGLIMKDQIVIIPWDLRVGQEPSGYMAIVQKGIKERKVEVKWLGPAQVNGSDNDIISRGFARLTETNKGVPTIESEAEKNVETLDNILAVDTKQTGKGEGR
ncbi:MAG: reverse transcriptase family protein, partial [bacterium]|nr:reverse transcriptase family protein [bacterium]